MKESVEKWMVQGNITIIKCKPYKHIPGGSTICPKMETFLNLILLINVTIKIKYYRFHV